MHASDLKKLEVRSRKSEVGTQKLELRSRNSEVALLGHHRNQHDQVIYFIVEIQAI